MYALQHLDATKSETILFKKNETIERTQAMYRYRQWLAK